jgi:hypothetical protein
MFLALEPKAKNNGCSSSFVREIRKKHQRGEGGKFANNYPLVKDKQGLCQIGN